MGLTDLIEKLIHEHGSFKEHLELLREQISILEKENSALKKEHESFKEHLEPLREQISILEKENSALKSENAVLKGRQETTVPKLSKATREVERLDDATKVPKKAGEAPRLDAVTKKVLKLFFDTGQELSVNQVAGKLSIDISAAQYQLDLLSEAKLIVQTTEGDQSSRMGETASALFELSYSGRKYVIEKKIVT